MFDFPIFEMPTIGLRMLMAINAIIHVFVSHGGAVGGSVVLALAAWWTNKKGDLAGYETVYRLLMVFFIITTSVGALTGIGMWIHANIIKPPTKYLNYAIISAWKKEMQEH
jgi:cytochrome bd-type quinol oxidase subunit 1